MSDTFPGKNAGRNILPKNALISIDFILSHIDQVQEHQSWWALYIFSPLIKGWKYFKNQRKLDIDVNVVYRCLCDSYETENSEIYLTF